MRTTFIDLKETKTPVLHSITYSPKSIIDKTLRYVEIDLASYVKSHTNAQHDAETWDAFFAECSFFRCIALNIEYEKIGT